MQLCNGILIILLPLHFFIQPNYLQIPNSLNVYPDGHSSPDNSVLNGVRRRVEDVTRAAAVRDRVEEGGVRPDGRGSPKLDADVADPHVSRRTTECPVSCVATVAGSQSRLAVNSFNGGTSDVSFSNSEDKNVSYDFHRYKDKSLKLDN